jgi:DNA-binding response OmpR family regulator
MNGRVLVVDDSVLMLDIVRDAFEGAGFEISTANTMEELQNYNPASFDVILMDVQMPELYGDDVASVLRHTRGLAARILLFSNLPVDELATRAAEAGLDGYFSKREGIDALVSRVRELLA